MVDVAGIRIVLPPELTRAEDKYRRLYAAVEALRLKHNTRAGDLSGEAVAFRTECRRVQTALLGEVLKLRPIIADPLWKPDPKQPELSEPNAPRLKLEGKADFRAADLKTITGIDLDSFAGIAEVPPDPLENFTTFREVDSADDITVAANLITVDTMRRDAVSYVHRDYGAGHFAAGLQHFIDIFGSAGADSGAIGGVWGVGNVIGTYANLATKQAVSAHFYQSTTDILKIQLVQHETATMDEDTIAAGTTYYCLARWPMATSIEFVLYLDAAHTNEFAVVAVAVTSGRSYQHCQTIYSRGAASGTASISYTVANLDLNEGAPPAGNRRRRLIICGEAA